MLVASRQPQPSGELQHAPTTLCFARLVTTNITFSWSLAQGYGAAEEDQHGRGHPDAHPAVHARWLGASHWGELTCLMMRLRCAAMDGILKSESGASAAATYMHVLKTGS